MCCRCSEHKGADQLCSYCEADLRLCFRPCMWFFSYAVTGLDWFMISLCLGNFLPHATKRKLFLSLGYRAERSLYILRKTPLHGGEIILTFDC